MAGAIEYMLEIILEIGTMRYPAELAKQYLVCEDRIASRDVSQLHADTSRAL